MLQSVALTDQVNLAAENRPLNFSFPVADAGQPAQPAISGPSRIGRLGGGRASVQEP